MSEQEVEIAGPVQSPEVSQEDQLEKSSLLNVVYEKLGSILLETSLPDNKTVEEDIMRRIDIISRQYKDNLEKAQKLDSVQKEASDLKKICLKLQDDLRSYDGIEGELEESEEQNEKLKNALKAAKDSFEAGLKEQKNNEQLIIKLRNDKNMVEQQLCLLNEKIDNEIQTKVRAVEKEKDRLEKQLKEKNEEVTAIKRTWDQASKQFEDEQKVLRQWKTNLEYQLENSEKTLQDINVKNSTEIQRLNFMILDQQKSVQESKYQVIEKDAELRSLQMNYDELKQSYEDKIKDLESQVITLSNKLKSESESNNSLSQKVGSFDQKLQNQLKESISQIEQKDREIIRQQQKNFDEEISRIRKQVSALSAELEQERASGRKLRDTVNKLNDTINHKDQMIDVLHGEVAAKDGELLAGRQQVTKLSRILARKISPNQQ
ncbi:hypothetical protein WA158_006459 [Blastocystis sp. Blastoise]